MEKERIDLKSIHKELVWNFFQDLFSDLVASERISFEIKNGKRILIVNDSLPKQ